MAAVTGTSHTAATTPIVQAFMDCNNASALRRTAVKSYGYLTAEGTEEPDVLPIKQLSAEKAVGKKIKE